VLGLSKFEQTPELLPVTIFYYVTLTPVYKYAPIPLPRLLKLNG
jgi:hypothetical protein